MSLITHCLSVVQHLRPRHRRMICAAALTPVLLLAYFLAYWLRFDRLLGPQQLQLYWRTCLLATGVQLAMFAALGALQGWSRHATFQDLIAVAQGATLGLVALAAVDYLFLWNLTIPRGVLLIDWGLTLLLVGGLRSLSRILCETRLFSPSARRRTPVFIVGDDESGETLLRAIRRNPRLELRVVGFITQNSRRVGSRLGGVPVRGLIQDIGSLTRRYDVKEVLITAEHLSGLQVRELVAECRRHEVAVNVVPCYTRLLRGDVSIQPRTVSIEDLLRRAPVQLDQTQLAGWLNDRVILITGGAGSIGSEICRQLLRFSPRKLIVLDRSENGLFFLERELLRMASPDTLQVCVADVNDPLRMGQVFREHRPEIVFHAAAYKHVPLMESHPGEAVKNICLATRNVADLANQYRVASFVMVSTDKAVNPANFMGTCKRIAELYVQSLAQTSTCQFVTVRFGNVLDSAGSVVPIFREQIARGGPVTVTHPDITRYFMTIPEASQLVIQAGSMGRGGEIFVLDMGDPVRILDLATDMVQLSGLKPGADIEIQFTGLRPGEKMYEELYANGEDVASTSHPKIMRAACERRDARAVARQLEELARLTGGPVAEIEARLTEIMLDLREPETSQTSRRKTSAA